MDGASIDRERTKAPSRGPLFFQTQNRYSKMVTPRMSIAPVNVVTKELK